VRARAVWKCLRVLAHIVSGLITLAWVFPKLTESQKEERIQAWAQLMLAKLAIQLIVKGSPPEHGPLMLASNHISWLDIVVLHAARHCRFVS
jgi:1-acyl-sn-glycerol-3-phosphate acyltransferase